MKIRTRLTELLNIDLPVIGAPMFLVSYPDLVSAVSEAGGIGCFPALNYRTSEELRDGLQEIRARTQKPIGVNLILHKEHNPRWPEQYEIAMQEKVELIITSLGSPRSIVSEIKATGASLFCDVTTLRHAEVVAQAGADALIAVAAGAGGHAGSITPFALFPYLKERTGLPVVAAGAISTGKQMAAAFALGADAVYVGTRLIATPEAQAADGYKQMLIDAKPEDIVYTDRVSGIPANWMRQSLEQSKDIIDNATGRKSLEDVHEDAKRWRDIWSAGHGVSDIAELQPAGDVIREMAREYLAVRNGLPGEE